MKLNLDGCCKGNPGTGGGGSVLRSNREEILEAWANFFGPSNNMKTEALALLHG